MATERQIAANRRNAECSTGPRTEAGKSISRRNAQWHGLTATNLLLVDGEDPDQFLAMRQALFDQWQPNTALEESLVGLLAATIWRLSRAAGFEAAIVAYKKDEVQHRSNLLRSNPFNQSLEGTKLLGRTIVNILCDGDLFTKLSRYERHLMRQVEGTIDQLRKLKGERPATSS